MSENKEPNAIYWPAGGKLLARITKNGKMVAIFKVPPTDEIGNAMAAALDDAKDVTQILLSVTPGPDGEGQENYAKSIDDVVERLGEQSDQIEALEARNAEQRIAELEKDAARYQWLRDKSQNHHQFYLSTPLYFTGVKFSKENVDSTIDAALNPNPEAEIPLCGTCHGQGIIATGIAEASSTICYKCEGTGRKGQ
jgi:hypothetical protein